MTLLMRTLSLVAGRRLRVLLRACLPQRIADLPRRLDATQVEMERLDAAFESLAAGLATQRAGIDAAYQNVLGELAEHARQRGEDRAELASVVVRSRPRDEVPSAPPREVVPAAADLDSFYSGFEERFRGTLADVTAKVVSYLPDVRAIATESAPLLDIGPGRGEWLTLLRDEGITAYGVDTNRRFVEMGSATGLDIRLEDALQHLERLPDRSLGAITAFQVVEHLPIDVLFDLVGHSLRVLQPGGILIVETPNPLNLRVGAAEFWIDPTHRHPLHPLFLEYLLTNRGFFRVEVRMAHPPTESPIDLAEVDEGAVAIREIGATVNAAFYGPCDYAVIGHRAGLAEPRALNR